ncbi:hypothetical protein C1X25_30470, partial [Pseudomonas sp. GW247-3R2A]
MNHKTKQSRLVLAQGALTLMMVGGAQGVMALSFDLPNPDYRLRWDNTVRYNLGMRTDSQDSRIMNTPNFDESDG